jgi:methionine-rich copper-binding protein CopC
MGKAFTLSVLLLGLAAEPALAHARLIRATPRVGSTVRPSPAELTLRFSESIDLSASTVTVSGPRGPAPTGPLTLDRGDGRVVHVPLPPALPPGAYRVDWGMTSVDTHHTEGDFRFRVAP